MGCIPPPKNRRKDTRLDYSANSKWQIVKQLEMAAFFMKKGSGAPVANIVLQLLTLACIPSTATPRGKTFFGYRLL